MATAVTRADVVAALTALDRRDIADGLYARRVDGDSPGAFGALALDFDEPTDLTMLVLALAAHRHVTPELLADCRAGKGAHPSDPGPDAIWWPSIRLDEPTAAQWADDMADCLACDAPPDAWGMDQPCLTHARAPWEPQLSGVS